MLEPANLMPDTSGINYYSADPDLSFLLRRHLSAEDYERAQGILTEMGAVASQKMDELAEIANRQGPVLVQYDKRGQRVDEVVFHPAYHELERIAYQDFAIAACCHREGALGWRGRVPQPVKFALGYLGMQAESGVFCPVSMTDALARVLERYASEPLKQRFLPSLTALTMAGLGRASRLAAGVGTVGRKVVLFQCLRRADSDACPPRRSSCRYSWPWIVSRA